jgi:hypothetical protein
VTRIEEHLLQTLAKQNEVIIMLLARLDNGQTRVRDIVSRGKRDPTAYLRLYNALDGSISVSDAAKLAGVTPGTVSPILRSWEEQGIIYDTGPRGRPIYRRTLLLIEKKEGNG